MRRITNILKKLAGPIQSVPAGAHVTIRHALVAEAGGELWATISLDDSHMITHPFRPSGELAFHLIERARELRRAERRRTRRAANLWPPAAPLGGSRSRWS